MLAVPWAVARKFGDDQAGGKAALMAVVLRYRLWPRSMIQPPLNRAGRLVYERLAQMQVRRPEQEITASFTEAAGEDPLAGRR